MFQHLDYFGVARRFILARKNTMTLTTEKTEKNQNNNSNNKSQSIHNHMLQANFLNWC